MKLLDPSQIRRPLTVGEVAERSGVAISAVRFYEAEGLIQSTRNAGNQRRFARETLRRVAVIKVAQRLGIPLASIREALKSLPEGRTPTAADWNRFSARWRAELDDRIEKLQQTPQPTQHVHRLRLPVTEGLPPAQPAGQPVSSKVPGPRLLDTDP